MAKIFTVGVGAVEFTVLLVDDPRKGKFSNFHVLEGSIGIAHRDEHDNVTITRDALHSDELAMVLKPATLYQINLDLIRQVEEIEEQHLVA
jgi:hypothetical protein